MRPIGVARLQTGVASPGEVCTVPVPMAAPPAQPAESVVQWELVT